MSETAEGGGPDDEARDRTRIWIGMIDRATAKGFTPLKEWAQLPDGERVRRDSEDWAEKLFPPAASPYRPGNAVVRTVHPSDAAAIDLLRHGYVAADGMRVDVVESAAFVLVRPEGEAGHVLKAPAAERADAIRRLAARLLNLTGTYTDAAGVDHPYQWRFALPAPPGDGARFSTNAAASPTMMPSWASRLDGGIHDGRVYFLLYKRRVSGDGRILVLDPDHWFDGKCWAPYAASRRG